jgi:hypothetical protein
MGMQVDRAIKVGGQLHGCFLLGVEARSLTTNDAYLGLPQQDDIFFVRKTDHV